MSALLKFLAAARSLASQGLKKEEIYSFAQREFGEVNELMKKQIDNIFKPQKPIAPKDPNFDNTVQKLGIDDQGKPFNPKDPLSNMATGGRAGYYGGGMTNSSETDLSDVGHGGDALNSRVRLLSPGSQATTSTGLNYLLGDDNDNTRVPFAGGGMGKRAFLKFLASGAAGIAGLKTGLFGLGKKAAVKTAAPIVAEAAVVPPHFLKLVAKIKSLGDDITETGALAERQSVKKYKDYEMTTDNATGKIEIQRYKNEGHHDQYGNGLTEETYMSYTPGETIIGKGNKPVKTLDDYEEGTAFLRNDREMTGEIVEESTTIADDIFEEVGEEIPEAIRKGKADGGRMGYGKGDIVTKGIPALLDLIKNKFGKKSITTADKIPTPQKTLDRDMFKAADNRLNDKKMMNADELEDFEMEIGDNIEAYYFDGTIGDAKRILQEEKNYMDEMFAEYKSIGGSKRLGGPKDPMKDAIDNASPGYTGDLKYDSQLVADDLAEKMYGVEYDDLTQAQQMDLYDKAYTALSKNQQGFKEMQKLSKPEKTLEGIKKTGVVDISNPDVAEEFTKFMKESDPKGFKDIEQKIQLESFDPKKTKGNAKGGRITHSSGGLAAMLGE